MNGKPLLAETLERASALDEYLAATHGEPEGDGWTTAGDLFQPGHDRLAAVLADIGRRWNTEDRRVQAAFFVNDYTWRLAGAAIAAYLSERRVPEPAAANVALRFDADGAATAPAFLTSAFAALANDTQARTAGARLLPDAQALRGWLLDRLETHLEAAVAAVRGHSPLGLRAQWALAADACASVYLWAGKRLGDQAAAACEAQAFLATRQTRLRARISFFAVEHAGRREVFMRRGSCCLSYRLPEHSYCDSCPFTPEDERQRRVREWMESVETE
jgi:hypothetical protein